MSSMSDSGGDRSACCNLETTLELIGISCSVFVILYLLITCARYFIARRLNPGGGARHRPKPGLDPSAIAALPSFAYRGAAAPESCADGEKGRSSAAECAVCLSGLEEGEMVRVLPNCEHMFHAACVDLWLRSNSTCPVCRADAVPGKAVEGAKAGEETCPQPPPPSVFHGGAAV